ncbi:hypothetical protein BKA70DRAFT_1222975 [Coprinopsis sp. MPI-PUGE-AT-0042]|nr:hypothetical protein BKA70DRAFT_1222975 [Coprinopsis sp. MPI-PUGE-AT-0042]
MSAQALDGDTLNGGGDKGNGNGSWGGRDTGRDSGRNRGFTGRDRDFTGRDIDRETDRRPPPLRRPGRQSLDEVAEATLLLLLVPDAELEPTPRLRDVGDERLHLEFDEVQEATLRLGEVDEVIPQFEEVEGMIRRGDLGVLFRDVEGGRGVGA